MIEKITNQNQIARHKLAEKINELIDAVNVLQLSIKPILEERKSEIKVYEEAQYMYDTAILDALKDKQVDIVVEPADPYAEQRKWIGKVCWFWDDDNTNSSCGILTSIDTETFKEPQFVCNDEYDYEHCEPVKPDDDIIYKGE